MTVNEGEITRYSGESAKKDQTLAVRTSHALTVPETIEQVGHLVDHIQGVLVDTYGLRDMRLRNPSEFLWPRKTSEATEKRIQLKGDEDPFYMSDGQHYENITMRSGNIIVTTFTNPKAALFRGGLLPFEALNPVIHLGRRRSERLQNANLPDLVAPDKLDDLVLVAEEVGHFLYEQTQHKLHKRLPGRIMQEGMAFLNVYSVLKGVVEETTGKSIFDPDSEHGKAIVGVLGRRLLKPLNMLRNGEIPNQSGEAATDFWLVNQYAKSSLIIGGFVIHIFENNQKGVDTGGELAKFYRLTGSQKARYLRDLYAEYVQNGDKSFKYNLETVKDRLETPWADKEFIDEEQKKGNDNRQRLSLEAGQAKEDALAKRLLGEDRKQLK